MRLFTYVAIGFLLSLAALAMLCAAATETSEGEARDTGQKILSDGSPPKKGKMKSARKKMLMVIWGIGVIALIGGIGFALWKVYFKPSKGKSQREEKRKEKKIGTL